MSDTDRRRFQRFRYNGTAMLIYDDIAQPRRLMLISHYLNLSRGGACLRRPSGCLLRPGLHLFVLPDQYRRKREAVIVACGNGLLHLELAASQQMSAFEIATLTRRFDIPLQG